MSTLLLALIYVCFISLGLPDSLLGSAWPVLHEEISVPVSYAGVISIVIFIGTILSSLLSDRLLKKFGAGIVTAFSIFLTAAGLFGFYLSGSFLMLILSSVPYGLGAGSVDAILNNYVALHYKAQHMSWLHCMWGVGASISPYIMSFSLARLDAWNYGYLIVFVIQIILSSIVFTSIPLWKRAEADEENEKTSENSEPISLRKIFSIKGAIPCFVMFFCYCSLELTASLWASSYLVEKCEFTPVVAAGLASMFYIGITLGRFINGFLSMRIKDKTLIRGGMAIILLGMSLLLIPVSTFTLVGFVVIGFGCAPIYPCVIHMTPDIFGKELSQAMIGVQMAFAYTGFMVMPPLFGVIAEKVSISLLPIYLFVIFIVMALMHETVLRKSERK